MAEFRCFDTFPYNKGIELLPSFINTKTIPITSQGWNGNLMQMDFINTSGASIGPSIAAVPGGLPNKMHYPARQDFLPNPNELKPPSEFPGMIIDPCYNIFYPRCELLANNYTKNVRYNLNLLMNND